MAHLADRQLVTWCDQGRLCIIVSVITYRIENSTTLISEIWCLHHRRIPLCLSRLTHIMWLRTDRRAVWIRKRPHYFITLYRIFNYVYSSHFLPSSSPSDGIPLLLWRLAICGGGQAIIHEPRGLPVTDRYRPPYNQSFLCTWLPGIWVIACHRSGPDHQYPHGGLTLWSSRGINPLIPRSIQWSQIPSLSFLIKFSFFNFHSLVGVATHNF